MASTLYCKAITLDMFQTLPQYEKVSANVEVLQLLQTEQVGHDKKLKRDVLIADHTTTAKVVLWEQQVNSLEKGKSYTLKNVHVNELPKNDFGNNKSKKPFHYCSVPFRRTVITVLFVCRFRRRYRSVLPSESFRFVSFRLCTLTVPAEIVERASDWPSGGYTHF